MEITHNRELVAFLSINSKRHPLYNGHNFVGRNKKADIVLKDISTSQQHALITILDNKIYISDLKSSNSTFVGAIVLIPLRLYELDDQCELKFGAVKATLIIGNQNHSEDNGLLIESQVDDSCFGLDTQLLENTSKRVSIPNLQPIPETSEDRDDDLEERKSAKQNKKSIGLTQIFLEARKVFQSNDNQTPYSEAIITKPDSDTDDEIVTIDTTQDLAGNLTKGFEKETSQTKASNSADVIKTKYNKTSEIFKVKSKSTKQVIDSDSDTDFEVHLDSVQKENLGNKSTTSLGNTSYLQYVQVEEKRKSNEKVVLFDSDTDLDDDDDKTSNKRTPSRKPLVNSENIIASKQKDDFEKRVVKSLGDDPSFSPLAGKRDSAKQQVVLSDADTDEYDDNIESNKEMTSNQLNCNNSSETKTAKISEKHMDSNDDDTDVEEHPIKVKRKFQNHLIDSDSDTDLDDDKSNFGNCKSGPDIKITETSNYSLDSDVVDSMEFEMDDINLKDDAVELQDSKQEEKKETSNVRDPMNEIIVSSEEDEAESQDNVVIKLYEDNQVQNHPKNKYKWTRPSNVTEKYTENDKSLPTSEEPSANESVDTTLYISTTRRNMNVNETIGSNYDDLSFIPATQDVAENVDVSTTETPNTPSQETDTQGSFRLGISEYIRNSSDENQLRDSDQSKEVDGLMTEGSQNIATAEGKVCSSMHNNEFGDDQELYLAATQQLVSDCDKQLDEVVEEVDEAALLVPTQQIGDDNNDEAEEDSLFTRPTLTQGAEYSSNDTEEDNTIFMAPTQIINHGNNDENSIFVRPAQKDEAQYLNNETEEDNAIFMAPTQRIDHENNKDLNDQLDKDVMLTETTRKLSTEEVENSNNETAEDSTIFMAPTQRIDPGHNDSDRMDAADDADNSIFAKPTQKICRDEPEIMNGESGDNNDDNLLFTKPTQISSKKVDDPTEDYSIPSTSKEASSQDNQTTGSPKLFNVSNAEPKEETEMKTDLFRAPSEITSNLPNMPTQAVVEELKQILNDKEDIEIEKEKMQVSCSKKSSTEINKDNIGQKEIEVVHMQQEEIKMTTMFNKKLSAEASGLNESATNTRMKNEIVHPLTGLGQKLEDSMCDDVISTSIEISIPKDIKRKIQTDSSKRNHKNTKGTSKIEEDKDCEETIDRIDMAIMNMKDNMDDQDRKVSESVYEPMYCTQEVLQVLTSDSPVKDKQTTKKMECNKKDDTDMVQSVKGTKLIEKNTPRRKKGKGLNENLNQEKQLQLQNESIREIKEIIGVSTSKKDDQIGSIFITPKDLLTSIEKKILERNKVIEQDDKFSQEDELQQLKEGIENSMYSTQEVIDVLTSDSASYEEEDKPTFIKPKDLVKPIQRKAFKGKKVTEEDELQQLKEGIENSLFSTQEVIDVLTSDSASNEEEDKPTFIKPKNVVKPIQRKSFKGKKVTEEDELQQLKEGIENSLFSTQEVIDVLTSDSASNEEEDKPTFIKPKNVVKPIEKKTPKRKVKKVKQDMKMSMFSTQEVIDVLTSDDVEENDQVTLRSKGHINEKDDSLNESVFMKGTKQLDVKFQSTMLSTDDDDEDNKSDDDFENIKKIIETPSCSNINSCLKPQNSSKSSKIAPKPRKRVTIREADLDVLYEIPSKRSRPRTVQKSVSKKNKFPPMVQDDEDEAIEKATAKPEVPGIKTATKATKRTRSTKDPVDADTLKPNVVKKGRPRKVQNKNNSNEEENQTNDDNNEMITITTSNSSIETTIKPTLQAKRGRPKKNLDNKTSDTGDDVEALPTKKIAGRSGAGKNNVDIPSTSKNPIVDVNEDIKLDRKRKKNVVIEPVASGSSTPSVAAKRIRSESDSLCLTPLSQRSKRQLKPKVVFTMLNSPELESLIRSLGGSVVDSVEICTVLVTASVKRTEKLLTAIGLGKPICSDKWLKECKMQNKFLDPWCHIFRDPEAETKWDFSLEISLERSQHKKLFQNYTMMLIVNAAQDILKKAIESTGGKCITTARKIPENFVIVSVPEKKKTFQKYISGNSGAIVVEPEAIFDAIVRQEIRFDLFKVA